MFSKATLNVQVGTRKQDVETTVAFDKNTFWLLDPKGKTLKAFPYSSIRIAEYSYSKSPRWKNVGSGAPLVTTGSGNKHWFMVQTQNDYALIALDKDNYRSVVGAFEIRSEKAVEKATESK